MSENKWNDAANFFINPQGKPKVDKAKTGKAEEAYAKAKIKLDKKLFELELKRLEQDNYDY